jgi:hypothetical protein
VLAPKELNDEHLRLKIWPLCQNMTFF